MQVKKELSCISIEEVSPTEFAALCIEAHAVVKPILADYLNNSIRNNQGAIYAAYDPSGECVGRVAVEVHPGYLTRGRSCATFGWLDAISQEIVDELLEHICRWVTHIERHNEDSHQRINLVRGPISFPKNLGGLGCQTEGFHLPRMHSVSTNRPELAEWIQLAGFKKDAPYACVDVSNAPRWASAQLAPGYSIVHWTQAEWRAHETEVMNALHEAFAGILPDSTGPGRFQEVIDIMSYHPDSKYLNPIAIGPSGDIAGMIVSTPNLYEVWDGHPVTGVNVDTVFISPRHRGMGLLSALNNVGRFNYLKYLHLTHVEGTSIWLANENAVKSIFPHGVICRRHVVFQKRLKKGNL